MRYLVEGDGSKIAITVRDVGARQTALLKELNECAEGRCSCPTPQYASAASAMDPIPALGLVGNEALRPIAEEAAARLHRVIDKLGSASSPARRGGPGPVRKAPA